MNDPLIVRVFVFFLRESRRSLAMDYSQSQHQQKRGGLVSLSPSQTPRSSDKSARDLRSGDGNSSSKNDKDKGVNVQVLLRCRCEVCMFPQIFMVIVLVVSL